MKAGKGILGLLLGLSILISGVCIGDDAADILDFLPAIIKKKIGNAVAKPFYLVPGVPTPVTITTYIPNANLDPASVQLKQQSNPGTSVIGNLTDSGNKVFSITNNFQGDNGGVIKLSITGTIGAINKIIATLNIQVLNIAPLQDTAQYNKNIDNIYSSILAAKTNFKTFVNPSTSTAQASSQRASAMNNLLSVYAGMEAIYRAETHSPSNYPAWAGYTPTYGGLLQAVKDSQDATDLFKSNANDPRVAAILTWAKSNALDDYLNTPQDREMIAQQYFSSGPGLQPILQQANTIVVKQSTEQFTDLAGGAIGDLFGGLKGFLIDNGLGAAVDKIIDIFIANNGQKGIAITNAADGQSLQVPAGSHDIIFSFGGILSRGIGRNIFVSQDSFTTINIGPGTINDYLKRWTFSLDSSVESSPAIGADGTIYAVGNKLYALNPDGSQKWASPTGGSISSPAIGIDGTIYMAVDSYFIAINPDGSRKWSNYAMGGYQIQSSPAIGADGSIYVGGASNLYALNPNGTQQWTFATGGFVYSSPAIDADGTIYVGSTDGKLYALNPNGTQKWAFAADSYIYSSSPVIGADGTIYISSGGTGTLYALASNGSKKWAFTTGFGVYPSTAIGANGNIYVGGYGKFYALNPDGIQQWSFNSGGIFNSPAIGADGTIFVASNGFNGLNHNLYALNPDGTVKWFFQTEKQIYSSPAIGEDGTIYFGADDGNLYAIYGNSGGLANSPWPMFHHDLKHTGRK